MADSSLAKAAAAILAIQEAKSVWREQPLDFITFLKEKCEIDLYEGPQLDAGILFDGIINAKRYAESGIPDQLQEVLTRRALDFDRLKMVTEFNLVLGKGSGKDWLCSLFVMYAVYWLTRLRSPAEYFGKAKGSKITVFNVAQSADQAKSVFFDYLKNSLKQCSVFKELRQLPKKTEGDLLAPDEYVAYEDWIQFSGNVVANSGHAKAESLEGGNVFMVVFDEIDGFETGKADQLYKVLRSSAVTRFGSNILLLFISYPRSRDGFILTKHHEATTRKNVLSLLHTTREVLGKHIRQDVIDELDQDFVNSPEWAECAYNCNPAGVGSPFYSSKPEAIAAVMNAEIVAIVQERIIKRGVGVHEESEEGEEPKGFQQEYIQLALSDLRLDTSRRYFLGGDGSESGDATVLSLMHAEPVEVVDFDRETKTRRKMWRNKPVEDLLLQWIPRRGLHVDWLNVQSVLEDLLSYGIDIVAATFDKYASQAVVQMLQEREVEAKTVNASNSRQMDWHQNMRTLVYGGMISLQPSSWGRIEMEHLQNINLKKVDHPANKKLFDQEAGFERKVGKDTADARAIAAYLCYTAEVEEPANIFTPWFAGAKIGGR